MVSPARFARPVPASYGFPPMLVTSDRLGTPIHQFTPPQARECCFVHYAGLQIARRNGTDRSSLSRVRWGTLKDAHVSEKIENIALIFVAKNTEYMGVA